MERFIDRLDRHIYIYISDVSSYISYTYTYMAVCQNLVPLVNIKIAGKWVFIPLKIVLIGINMVLIGIDP